MKSDQRSDNLSLCNLEMIAAYLIHGLGFSLQNAFPPHQVCVSRTLCKLHMIMKGLNSSHTGVSYSVYHPYPHLNRYHK